MLKAIGGAAVFLSCLGIGFYKSARLKQRCDSLETLSLCAERIAAEISFSKKRIERIFNETARDFKLPLFADAAVKIHTCGIKSAWQQSLGTYSHDMALTRRDISAAAMLGSIGDFSGEEQQRSIQTARRLLGLAYEEARADRDRTAKLYRSCGVLCGILAVILLI